MMRINALPKGTIATSGQSGSARSRFSGTENTEASDSLSKVQRLAASSNPSEQLAALAKIREMKAPENPDEQARFLKLQSEALGTLAHSKDLRVQMGILDTAKELLTPENITKTAAVLKAISDILTVVANTIKVLKKSANPTVNANITGTTQSILKASNLSTGQKVKFIFRAGGALSVYQYFSQRNLKKNVLNNS